MNEDIADKLNKLDIFLNNMEKLSIWNELQDNNLYDTLSGDSQETDVDYLGNIVHRIENIEYRLARLEASYGSFIRHMQSMTNTITDSSVYSTKY